MLPIKKKTKGPSGVAHPQLPWTKQRNTREAALPRRRRLGYLARHGSWGHGTEIRRLPSREERACFLTGTDLRNLRYLRGFRLSGGLPSSAVPLFKIVQKWGSHFRPPFVHFWGPKNPKKSIRVEFLGVLEGLLKMEPRPGLQKVRFCYYLLHLS